MIAADRFRINSPSVASEDFDDETILVNLETGEYFSTRDTGAEIWRRLAKGAPVAAVEQAMLAHYEVEAEILAESLSTFVATLRERGLLVPLADSEPTELEPEPAVAAKRTFLPPSLDVYSDMQDLLLLDPIHEVDPSGWPNPK